MITRTFSIAAAVCAFVFALASRTTYACTDSTVSVSVTNYACSNVGKLHIAYGADVSEIIVMKSDVLGNWDSNDRVTWYPDGAAGEAVWSAGQWPGTPGGYILVASRPGCSDFKGLAGVFTQVVKVPEGECPIFPPPTINKYFLQLEVATDPAAPYVVEQEIPSTRIVNAQLSLGTIFSPKIVQKQIRSGQIASVVPVVSTYSVASNKIAPAFETQSNLWDTSTLLSLSGGASVGTAEKFTAVHLGRMSFAMLPLSVNDLSTVTLNIEVARPPALGDEHQEWDDRIIDAAHERGIPPQIIKGQIRQESPGFGEGAFRYEPCSSDFAEISKGRRLIDTEPYKFYAMDDPALEDRGLADTVDLRNQLYIIDPTSGVRRHIAHSDSGVTARQIWEASDIWPPNDPRGHGQLWSRQTCGALNTFLRHNDISAFPGALEFVAQTPTASSYGVLQAMYTTALRYEWSVPDPENPGSETQSPRYLRDTEEALALHHGGSLFVGGAEDVQLYWDLNSDDPASFSSQEEFFDSFKDPLRMYTGGGKSQANYGINIIDTYQFDYLPHQPAHIFH